MKLSFPAEFVATLASPEQLALELFGGTIRVWHTDDQFPTIKLSVKYAILHKLALLTGIHPYIWPPTFLAQLIYLIGTRTPVHHSNILTEGKVVGPAPKSLGFDLFVPPAGLYLSHELATSVV
ncbi:uncharacterized protein E6C27_scaffold1299G00030 [Cucumis melo var. makuwa]|uniref:Uncharacterized protein n=1 Tax=Cucumis melo var. makuwa TaxID=1194695 RepID=A0A5A7UGX8_CUCMM|nr:uncharacterized protein E6C27_scaffold1299G00030 [Cucumis melo var. makuwa]